MKQHNPVFQFKEKVKTGFGYTENTSDEFICYFSPF